MRAAFDEFEILCLAVIGLRAARRALGKPEQIEQDGLGEWRAARWCERVRRWLSGDLRVDGLTERTRALDIAARDAVLIAASRMKTALLSVPRLAEFYGVPSSGHEKPCGVHHVHAGDETPEEEPMNEGTTTAGSTTSSTNERSLIGFRVGFFSQDDGEGIASVWRPNDDDEEICDADAAAARFNALAAMMNRAAVLEGVHLDSAFVACVYDDGKEDKFIAMSSDGCLVCADDADVPEGAEAFEQWLREAPSKRAAVDATN